jgi:hypothetical protein
MELIRSIQRWVPRWGINYPPTAELVDVRLCRGNMGPVVILTPWACLEGAEDASDRQLAAALGLSFDTEAEALAEARRRVPYAGQEDNEAFREDVLTYRRNLGQLCGDGAVSDKWAVSVFDVPAIACGAKRAPKITRRIPVH